MKKTRSFLLAAGIMLATTFTFSCSDDDGGNPSSSSGGSSSSVGGGGNPSSSSGGNGSYGQGACYAATVPILPGVQICMKFSIDVTAAMCERDPDLTYRESCEPNPVLTCEKDGEPKVLYLYGTLPSGFSCEDLPD